MFLSISRNKVTVYKLLFFLYLQKDQPLSTNQKNLVFFFDLFLFQRGKEKEKSSRTESTFLLSIIMHSTRHYYRNASEKARFKNRSVVHNAYKYTVNILQTVLILQIYVHLETS